MIKTILVPATGSDTDDAVFMSALAVARAYKSGKPDIGRSMLRK